MKKILIVDDDLEIRNSLKQILEMEGYAILMAPDGLVALELLRAEKQLPNLILLDLMMPEMNGWEFNEEKKLEPKLASIPVVVITAAGHAEAAAKPIQPAAVLRKPLDLTELLNTVSLHCSNS